jgi:hypothetical protein
MKTVQELFKPYLTYTKHQRQRKIVREKFKDYLPEDKSFLSLFRYINKSPEKYYSENSFKIYFQFLDDEFKKHRDNFKILLSNNNYKINNSIRNLNLICNETWHEEIGNIDNYDEMLSFDLKINHAYLKLLESVLYPLIYLIAYQSRVKRGKSTEKLDIYNCVEELRNTIYESFTITYDNTIRNGIAHGGITYNKDEISFIDKEKRVEITYRDFLRKVDDLIDNCNAIILAINIFYIKDIDSGIIIPKELMIEELKAETNSPWWNIEGSLDSTIINGESQLMIFARPNTTDINKIRYTTVMTGILAEYYAPGYKRYFISLKSPVCLPGWAAFDGDLIKEKRLKNADTFEEYKGIIIENLIFFVPTYKLPRYLYKLNILFHSFKIHFSLALKDLRKELNKLDIIIKNASIHRNGWRLVLNSSVIINNDKSGIDLKIKAEVRRIIKLSLKKAKKQNKKLLLNLLPLGYARISLFEKDYRKRRIASFGLNKELIGTIQMKKIKRIKVPDIFNSTIDVKGKYRFAWNNKKKILKKIYKLNNKHRF